MEDINILKIENNKEDFMELLLEADPDESIVKEYINKGDMFVYFENNKHVCIAIVIKIDEDVIELKNIATAPDSRGKGYAGKIIKYLFENYRDTYKRMIVGTTENMIPFYVLKGFTKYYKTIKNFFVDNYEEEIWDGDLHCIDMYYYSKEF